MPLTLRPSAIALRLALTVAAAALIGWNRSERGRPAGLRTTILVGVAACLSMLEVNALLTQTGKAADSFVVLDLMRLPLGILSGMGFIGAGTILRRDNLVLGVTTAATLWFVTMLGLCFGGGQIALGLSGLAIGFAALAALRGVEEKMNQSREGKLQVVTSSPQLSEAEICSALTAGGVRVESVALTWREPAEREIQLTVHWKAPADRAAVPAAVIALGQRDDVIRVAWWPGP